mmetsp:Transcript_17245/g.44239  ORF Transcript_17245/g.44239 Transcript_17245/m.44239 type:complete len:379 (+) Transcript_17245:100-1236(+)
MSFLGMGGAASLQPTYFELLAAERLTPSLKAAVVYTLSVFSQRYPWLHRLLDAEDEVFGLLLALLNAQSLRASSATFAEALYGMQRVRAGAAGAGAEAGAVPPSGGLSRAQLRGSLLASVLLPYLGAKLDSLQRRAAAAGGGRLGGLQVVRYQESQPQTAAPRAVSRRQQLLLVARWLCPWLRAGVEGASATYQMAYLLGATRFYSPVLQALGLTLGRVSGTDMMARDQARQASRNAALAVAAASGSAPVRWLRAGWVRGGALLADHGHSLLILSLFSFKFLDWWYTAAEPELQRSKRLPPPPPPPPPSTAPGGISLPADPSLCPLCRGPRANPALLAVSGFAFCYPCIFRHVAQHGRCPITHLPARQDHIRSLYEDS